MLSTRKKIVVIADQLIRLKGYNAFSYADIATKLAIKNSAIHYHFQSKSVLGKAVIEASREKFKANTLAWSVTNNFEQIEAFIEMYSSNSKNNSICFMGALGSSYPTLPIEMKEALNLAHIEITNWLMVTLKDGKKNGVLFFKESVEEMSDLITSSMLASLILARVSNNSVIKNVSKTLLTHLEKK